MDELSRRLDELGDAVAEVDDQAAPEGTLAEARRRLLAPAVVGGRKRPAARYLLAAAVVTGLVVTLFVLSNRGPVTSFEVGVPPVAGVVGDWVAADEATVPMRFSDGSAFELRPGSRVRVAEMTGHGAALVIERGTVGAKIVHTSEDTRWSLRAGHFTVLVLGTAFDAQWVPGTETLQVVVSEGTVVVSGPLLPPDRKIFAGERLIVSLRDQRMDLTTAAALASTPAPPQPHQPAAASAASALAEADEPPEAGAGGSAATGSGGGAAAVAKRPAWRALGAKGKYKQAMADIERRGFDVELGRSSADGLRALADVARFAGQPGRAQQALLSLRKRYGASGYTAFQLGRLAADQLGSPAEAVQWFETYLQEAPGGPLAEQALGRILDIQRHGSPKAAKQAAKRYLARYPNGAYAALARSVLAP